VVPAHLASRIGARSRAGQRDAWPAVVSIALGTFALVVSELIPGAARGHQRAPARLDRTGGLMVVVPAVTAAVAAPLLTLCSARLERRRVLVGLSVLVLVSDVIAGVAPGFGVMLAARAVLGIGVGGFSVFGAGAAITLVSERARGTAAPHLGAGGRLRPRSLLTVVTLPVPRIGLVAAGAIFFANFAAYTYIGPLLHTRAGLGASAITIVLLGFGLAGAAGNFAAGVTVPTHLRATLMGSGLLIAVSALLLAVLTGARPLTIALVAVWGLGFGAVPVAAQSWMAQPTRANVEGGPALFVSALRGSLAAGRWLGGRRRDLCRPRAGRRPCGGRGRRGRRITHPAGLGRHGHQLSVSRPRRSGPRAGPRGAGTVARRDRYSRKQRTADTLTLPFAAMPRPLPGGNCYA
jgi:predicted MFS family arabinose efflux permease